MHTHGLAIEVRPSVDMSVHQTHALSITKIVIPYKKSIHLVF